MISVDPDLLRNLLILFNWIIFSWELYLRARQYMVVSRSPLPEWLNNKMDEEYFENARRYNLSKLKLSILESLQIVGVVTWILHTEQLYNFWDDLTLRDYSELMIRFLAFYTFMLTPIALNLPFHIYDTFVIEKRCGFKTRSLSLFVWKGIKNILSEHIVLSVSILMSMTIGFLTRVISIDNYYNVWLWLLVSLICFFINTIYPKLVELFYKCPLLPPGKLKSELEDLASQHNYSVKEIVVNKNLHKSLCGNVCLIEDHVYLKPTVLNDTSEYTTDEILAMFAHELCHWKLKHYKKKNNAKLIYTFLTMALVFWLWDYKPLFKALGFRCEKPRIVIGFAILYFFVDPATRFSRYLLFQVIRKSELEADDFVVKLGKAEPFKEAILHLWKDFLLFPVCDRLYSQWFFPHLPLDERLENIESQIDKLK